MFRRTMPAMAVTLAICAALFFGLRATRPFYAMPERLVQTTALSNDNDLLPDASLRVDPYWIDRSGMRSTDQERQLALARPCGTEATTSKYATCSFSHGYRQVGVFHPASRFWRFQ